MRTHGLAALAVLLLVPAGGCGVVSGVLFGTSAIEVCNDAAVGDIVEAIDLVNDDCSDPSGGEETSGDCDAGTDEALWPGDCTRFGGLEPGRWILRVRWTGGSTDILQVDVSLFSTSEVSLEYGG